MWVVLVLIAVAIVVGLSVVAYRLRQQVKDMEAEQAQQEKALAEQQQAKRDSMNKSIQILAQGLITDQVTKTEAAIRIGALMEFLGVDENTKEEFSALYQLAEASAHIPILEKWKALPTKEKMRYDNERMVLEEQYGDFVMDAAQRIIGRTF